MSDSQHTESTNYPLESPPEPGVEAPVEAVHAAEGAAAVTPAPPAGGGSSNVVDPAAGTATGTLAGGAVPGAATGLLPFVQGSVEAALLEQGLSERPPQAELDAEAALQTARAKLGDEASETATTVETAIQRWLHDRMRNSPISQAVDAWNHLVAELDSLRDAIVKEL